MSHSPAPSASHNSSSHSAHAAQSAHAAGRGGARKPGGPETAADQFANLLSLLSASDALPATAGVPDGLMPDTAEAPSTETGEAELEAMMAWAALPSAAGAPAGATTGAAADGSEATATGGLPGPATGTLPTTTTTTTTANPDSLTAAAPGDAKPDTLQGLQVLAQPEALDEQTLAQLPAAEAGPAPEAAATPPASGSTPAAGNSATATPAANARPGAWRSTAQMAGTTALQQWHHAQAQSAPASERAAVRIDAGQAQPLRSTIALDQRYTPAATGDEAPATAPLAAVLPAGAAPVAGSADTAGQSGPGADPGASGGDASDNRDSLRSETPDDAYQDALAEADAQAEDRLDSFASPHLRQASLRIGEDGESAIDVRLSLTGQELDLSFRTDSAEARAELRQSAEGTLGELLQRGGLQLGEVSVGDQRGQQGQPGQGGPTAPPSRPGAPSTRADSAPSATGPAALAAPRPRSDGSRPLDLFV